jgi:outer membrane scaffolding protein for murein synthesis (MipA/OmpV family)
MAPDLLPAAVQGMTAVIAHGPRPAMATGRVLAVLGLPLAGAWQAAVAQAAPQTQVESAPARQWDAAVGFVANHGPRYPGADRTALSLTPGLAVRWGRVSFASRSAFSVRGADAAAGGGLRVELAQGERLRAGLGLRLDSGRRESDSAELRGMGDVRGTLNLRLSVSYRLDGGWRLRSATTLDALGRGSGVQGDLQLSRDLQIAPALSMNGALSLGWADRRHLQTYFGVTPEQALRSGYPTTSVSAGARDLTMSVGLRKALGPRWAVFGSASLSRLLDQAASSPLTRQPGSWGLGFGVVHRL